MTEPTRSAPSPSEQLGELVRGGLSGEVSQIEHAKGRARFINSIESLNKPRWQISQQPGLLWGLAAAVIVVTVGLISTLKLSESTLVLVPPQPVDTATAVASATLYKLIGTSADTKVLEAKNKPIEIQFVDGSRVELLAGSTAKIERTSTHQADLALTEGAMEVSVRHFSDTRYRIVADRHVVEVVGTSFRVEVHDRPISGGTRREFALHMHEGEVHVLEDGGRVHVVRGVETLTLDRPVLGLGAASGTSPSSSSSVPAVLAPKPADTWSSLAAAGQWAKIVQQAREAGTESVLSSRGEADLSLLADAARLTRGEAPLARQALERIRSRFSGSTRATSALFLLGRLAEEAERNPARAVSSYEQYLAEAPNGPHADAARGRKMLLVRGLRGDSAARELAVDYLARHPSGSYAKLAHELTR